MFGWFDPEKRHRRRKVMADRKHLAARSRRFLRNYLHAGVRQKAGYYRVLRQASKDCRPASALSSPEMSDNEIAEATADAAMTKVLERVRLGEADDFVTDAYATVAVAYRRAAGMYSADRTMQKLGTAAVHLLTIATSHGMKMVQGNYRDKSQDVDREKGERNDRQPV
jgi:hypothetical protein